MKLYICWGTFPVPLRPGNHPCRNAYRALREAGHDPEVIKSYVLAPLPYSVGWPAPLASFALTPRQPIKPPVVPSGADR